MTSTAIATFLALSTGFLDGISSEWNAGSRTRVSAQSHRMDSLTTDGGQADLELLGTLRLGTPQLDLDLTYEPTFSAYAPVSDPNGLFLQRGTATATWRRSEVSALDARTSALYGEVRLTQTPTATDPIDRVPGAYVVRRTSFSQSLGSELQLSALSVARARLDYTYDRAVTPAETTSLPPQHTFRGAAEASWNVRPLDALGARVEGEVVETEGAGSVVIARTMATLRHDLGQERAWWAGLGATLTHDGDATTPGGVGVVGAGDPAWFGRGAGGTAELRVDTRVDRLSGAPTVELEGTGTVAVPLAVNWRSEVVLRGGAFFSGPAGGTRLGSGEVRVIRAFGERAELSAAYYYFVQSAEVAPRQVQSHAVDLTLAIRLHRVVAEPTPPSGTVPAPPGAGTATTPSKN